MAFRLRGTGENPTKIYLQVTLDRVARGSRHFEYVSTDTTGTVEGAGYISSSTEDGVLALNMLAVGDLIWFSRVTTIDDEQSIEDDKATGVLDEKLYRVTDNDGVAITLAAANYAGSHTHTLSDVTDSGALAALDELPYTLIESDAAELSTLLGFDGEGDPVTREAGDGISISDTEISADFGTTATTVATGNRGLPVGGTTGQVLKKQSGSNFDVDWEDESGGGGSNYNHVTDATDYSATAFEVGTDGALQEEERRFTNTTGTQQINFPAGIAEDSFGAFDVGAGVTAEIIGAATVTIDGVVDRGGAGAALSLPGRFSWRATALNVIEFAPSSEGTQDVFQTLDLNNNELQNAVLAAGVVVPEVIMVAASDETTDLTTGTAKITFRMPFAMTLTGVRASVTTAPTGANLVVDINEGGATLLSTKLSIDATETTSTTAATPAVISDTALADDAEMTIDIDQIGSTVAGAGLKVTLIGTRTLA